jgi:enoyl-CoA hydratase/carnithine racemase
MLRLGPMALGALIRSPQPRKKLERPDMSVLQSTQDGVRTMREGVILEVTLDRPKANAIDLAASRRLNAIFTAFRDDPALRVAIVTGAGEKFFRRGGT